MSERDFWIAVRQALLIIVSAIERRHMQRQYKHVAVDGAREVSEL
jgi:hypothetical protein